MNLVSTLYIVLVYLVILGNLVLKYTGLNLQTLPDKDLILTIEKKKRGGISSVMGDRYVKSDAIKKIIYIDATKLYGNTMSQVLPYDEIELWQRHPGLFLNKLEEVLITSDDSHIGYFIEVDLKYPHNTKNQRFFHFIQKTKSFLKINIMII